MTTIPQRLRDIAFRLRKPRDGRPWGADDGAADLLDAIAAELEAPAADAVPVVNDYPAGAVENGRAYAARLESAYQFYCEAGPLSNCSDWHELIRCFEHLAAWSTSHIATVAALQARINELESQLNAIEHSLEGLVNRCNADAFISTDEAVIHAEATLERLYIARRIASSHEDTSKEQP